MTYTYLKKADVGFWLREDLVRLLYPHSTLKIDLRITDKRSAADFPVALPSWYSPEQLLTNTNELNVPTATSRPKVTSLFCNTAFQGNGLLAYYLNNRTELVQEVLHDRYAQLDAYLFSIHGKNDKQVIKDKYSKVRPSDVPCPNETDEQRQLYSHADQFWPLKQHAAFPIDDIISSEKQQNDCSSRIYLSEHRSSFPDAGPLETASLTLLELAYRGEEKDLYPLLMHRSAYVDVCDARGLTALHFASYNAHLNVINVLLNFGANVNQLSDDGVTPLTLASLLYFGTDPEQTLNLALEHRDPTIDDGHVRSANGSARLTPKDQLTEAHRVDKMTSPGRLAADKHIIEEVKSPTMDDAIKLNETSN